MELILSVIRVTPQVYTNTKTPKFGVGVVNADTPLYHYAKFGNVEICPEDIVAHDNELWGDSSDRPPISFTLSPTIKR